VTLTFEASTLAGLMPHIQLPEELPGIRGLLAFRPETAKPLGDLADALLHAPGTLSPGDREMIAAYVSRLNDCTFCHNSHAAIAACHLENENLVTTVMQGPDTAAISEKLKALLAVAARVQQGGRAVRTEDIDRARRAGATDTEIHDTVLIAAAFCMFNRYVDALATWAPSDPEGYRQRAADVAKLGYGAVLPQVQASGTHR
jgi:uncharacterized peroxidase-related enzyme